MIELGVPGYDNQSKVDIRTSGRYRFKVSVVRRGKEGRQVDSGPLVPGPWAYAFGLCTVLSATPIDHDPILDVEDGDLLVIEGDTYKLTIIRRQWVELELVIVPGFYQIECSGDCPPREHRVFTAETGAVDYAGGCNQCGSPHTWTPINGETS